MSKLALILAAQQQGIDPIGPVGIAVGAVLMIAGAIWAKKRRRAGLNTMYLGMIVGIGSFVFLMLSIS